MASALEAIQTELEGIEKQLDGYDELVQHRDRLRAALSVLEGSGPLPRTQPAARAPRARRSSTGIDEGAIVHAIHSHGEPASAIDIRQRLGLADNASNSLSIKLKKMVDDGILKRIGERRASRYTVA